MTNNKQQTTNNQQLAAKVLEDPLLLRSLSEQVYELMLLDLEQQLERSRTYRRRF
ncbi:MAG: hypothetical protein F6K47_26705 [Symploca sp. SIO2E6]|nr:hypothetical protein [Symploca sp. SIO2E6]